MTSEVHNHNCHVTLNIEHGKVGNGDRDRWVEGKF